MRLNKKGQGALEYLLLIGGAVLIAVIVIALLVGMGSSNAESARQRNEQAMEATDTPIPSVIVSAMCLPDSNVILVNWQPIHKESYKYMLTATDVNGTMYTQGSSTGTDFNTSVNPARIEVATGKCAANATVTITTFDGNKSAVSNTYIIR